MHIVDIDSEPRSVLPGPGSPGHMRAHRWKQLRMCVSSVISRRVLRLSACVLTDSADSCGESFSMRHFAPTRTHLRVRVWVCVRVFALHTEERSFCIHNYVYTERSLACMRMRGVLTRQPECTCSPATRSSLSCGRLTRVRACEQFVYVCARARQFIVHTVGHTRLLTYAKSSTSSSFSSSLPCALGARRTASTNNSRNRSRPQYIYAYVNNDVLNDMPNNTLASTHAHTHLHVACNTPGRACEWDHAYTNKPVTPLTAHTPDDRLSAPRPFWLFSFDARQYLAKPNRWSGHTMLKGLRAANWWGSDLSVWLLNQQLRWHGWTASPLNGRWPSVVRRRRRLTFKHAQRRARTHHQRELLKISRLDAVASISPRTFAAARRYHPTGGPGEHLWRPPQQSANATVTWEHGYAQSG